MDCKNCEIVKAQFVDLTEEKTVLDLRLKELMKNYEERALRLAKLERVA